MLTKTSETPLIILPVTIRQYHSTDSFLDACWIRLDVPKPLFRTGKVLVANPQTTFFVNSVVWLSLGLLLSAGFEIRSPTLRLIAGPPRNNALCGTQGQISILVFGLRPATWQLSASVLLYASPHRSFDAV